MTTTIKAERKSILELKDTDGNVEVLATVVQAFEPRFFEVCPKCGKRAREKEGFPTCIEHGKVSPDYSYVLTVFLDDGTETIRAAFFRENAEKLLNIGKEQILSIKNNPSLFEEIKSALLGSQLKVVGRVNKNAVFDRIELMVNSFSPADPEEEIKRLAK